MKNKKAEEVIKRLQDENETFAIQLTGDRKNQASGFYILINTQAFNGGTDKTFGPIEKSTLALFDEAEIKYKILE